MTRRGNPAGRTLGRHCGGKRRYHSRTDADATADRLVDQGALADDTAPRQIRLTFADNGFAVSCNCRRTPPPGGGSPSYPPLALWPFHTPSETILASYREHLDATAGAVVDASTTAR